MEGSNLLQINETWALGADSLSIMLYKRRSGKPSNNPNFKKAEGIKWDTVGYFATVRHAFDHLVELEIKDTDLQSFKVVTEKLDELHNLINTLPEIKVSDLIEKTGRGRKRKVSETP